MKLQIVEEPQLAFFQNDLHVDIRAGLSTFGAFDKGSASVPTPIRIGMIGTTATVDGVRDWLERCKDGVPSDEQKLKALRPAFPGMTQQVFGTSLELSDTLTRTITRHELTAALRNGNPLPHLVEVFMDHARDLASKSGLHVLVVAPPPEVFALGDVSQGIGIDPPIDELQQPAPEQEVAPPSVLNFHDLFKAQAIDLQLPCQLLRPDTYGSPTAGRVKGRRIQDKATTAWNFHTALYYKAGGVPWRLARQPALLTTCYVGVSFFKSVDGDKLMTSVAQVFDERGEGLIVQGGSASYDKDDRSPHLSEDDAFALLANGLATYRREHKNMPARLVMHKTSSFNAEEKAGFRRAADNEKLEVLDLVTVRRSGVRLLRAGQSPMIRGTSLLFDDASGIVYLKGTVPYFQVYPGAYIPRAIEFIREDGETSSAELARELVGLSKLNFNNTQFDSGDPITVRAARRVGDILKHVPANKKVNARFRYFT
ncbi:argonaute/piwi family protein [Edaphobacter dinghuensis]|uniref:Piwi domain-containing protein n=1 Tax=Edaphobacter dinghuensis TaxID=1560005 RepID=A0A917HRK5_9BACT|nr:hypothetical protein [Edaphobacter dinghuensis]GGG87369.1 hypothetical protein GCM10011585_34300 [Edaphobacter dinghuensis]